MDTVAVLRREPFGDAQAEADTAPPNQDQDILLELESYLLET